MHPLETRASTNDGDDLPADPDSEEERDLAEEKRLKNIKTKARVVEEMVQTEKTYAKGLEWLVKWKNELEETKIIKEDDIQNLFSTVLDNLKSISDVFLADITKKFESWDENSTVGDVFESIAPFFRLYVDYCNNNELSGQTLTKLMKKNKLFKDYVLSEEASAGMTFESFLITPIQRIPRYEMLISSALKYTNEGEKDKPHLENAVNLVHKVWTENNKSMAMYTGQK